MFCLVVNGSLGVIDPLVFLYFQNKYRREIMKLLRPILIAMFGSRAIRENLDHSRGVSTIDLRKRQTIETSSKIRIQSNTPKLDYN